MKLFIDGDALPNLLKPILLKSINRLQLQTFVIANKKINIGESNFIEFIIVKISADEADHKIVEMVEKGDLVITADIPLADRIISKDAHAIDHRGELYSKENIKHLLAMRNLMAEIRESGEILRGAPPFSKKDVHQFANQLNSFLAKWF